MRKNEYLLNCKKSNCQFYQGLTNSGNVLCTVGPLVINNSCLKYAVKVVPGSSTTEQII